MKSLEDTCNLLGQEARYTGDKKYFNKFYGYLKIVMQEKNRRYQLKAEGKRIVKSVGGVEQVVIPTPEEREAMEAEKKRQEEEQRQKEEEEKRKKEEEEKKRLEAEAKRKEQLVIAEAQLKAAEELRKQEQLYENVLQKMITDPGSVTD